ncbi:MAG: TIGR00282 family metallophosphoesterase [Firmicutes bacterium]|nr:TIGR00282 family metallophosphoesterase [Bacillota bacterium]MDD4263257.1 TIGR00282 family metallophosphoesterase [Bacillota bacterium]MDD4693129.1 TIGR00282 family metallophosphoesterase [Bacillota bacterium]
MRVLMVGDVVGRPGRKMLNYCLPKLSKEKQLDFVIANGENSAGGFGITSETFKELKRAGVDVVTSGNHIWDKRDSGELIDSEPRLLRPANYPPGVFGTGSVVVDVKGVKVGVINLAGRIFMDALDCPFRKAKELVLQMKDSGVKLVFVDMHAEATSEKEAMGFFLDGDVTAVVGTHTHVPTGDERVLEGGTAYQTDLGMTGPRDGVLGVDKDIIISKFLEATPKRFDIAKGALWLCGLIIEADETTGRALSLERVRIEFEKDNIPWQN